MNQAMSIRSKKSDLVRVLIGAMFVFSCVVKANAQDEEVDANAEQEGVTPTPSIYLPIKPAFVVNYGGEGRLKYIKTELSVRLSDSDAANSVRHHLPYIRHNLVMLFSAQTDEELSSQEGREMLRQNALTEIKKVVEQEDGSAEGVVDLYFNTFIVQK